jgi:hypothetical protein
MMSADLPEPVRDAVAKSGATCEMELPDEVYTEAVSSNDGYVEDSLGRRRFNNPALERVSCDHEDFLLRNGLSWAIEHLNSLLDRERGCDASMAFGHGRALEYAIGILDGKLTEVMAAGLLQEIDKELSRADISSHERAAFQERREQWAAILQQGQARQEAIIGRKQTENK